MFVSSVVLGCLLIGGILLVSFVISGLYMVIEGM